MYKVKVNHKYILLIKDLGLTLSYENVEGTLLTDEQFENSLDIQRSLRFLTAEKISNDDASIESNSNSDKVINEPKKEDVFISHPQDIKLPEDVFISHPQDIKLTEDVFVKDIEQELKNELQPKTEEIKVEESKVEEIKTEETKIEEVEEVEEVEESKVKETKTKETKTKEIKVKSDKPTLENKSNDKNNKVTK